MTYSLRIKGQTALI